MRLKEKFRPRMVQNRMRGLDNHRLLHSDISVSEVEEVLAVPEIKEVKKVK